MIDRARTITVGDTQDYDTDMGPLISREQHDRVTGYIELGLKEGATSRSAAAFRGARLRAGSGSSRRSSRT